MKALDRYQASRGNKFSTYATWWIKQTITRSIAYQSRTVRIPIHAINNLNRLIEERESFVKREGREPSLEEMAAISKLPAREVNRLFELNRTSLSLDQPYGTGDEGQLGELIEDEKLRAPIESTQRNQLRERIRKLLKQLSYREREVLKLRYGLDDGNMYTLEEVGQMFKVSRERIRQVEVGALQKLQLPVRKEKLKAFWEEINE
jgi:RNA polymerase primary sigma factor